MSLHDNRISVLIFLAYLCLISHSHVYVFRISCKDLKSMLGQVNYRVPNMRFLREKLPVTFFRISIFIGTHYAHFSLYLPISFFTSVLVKACDLFLTTFMTIPPSSCLSQDSELRNGDVSFSQFAQLYRSLMFDAQKNVSVEVLCRDLVNCSAFIPHHPIWCTPEAPSPSHLSVLKWLHNQYEKSNLNPVVVAIKVCKHSPRQWSRLVCRLSGVKLFDHSASHTWPLSPQQEVCLCN